MDDYNKIQSLDRFMGYEFKEDHQLTQKAMSDGGTYKS